MISKVDGRAAHWVGEKAGEKADEKAGEKAA